MAKRSCSGPELELQFPCAGCGHNVFVRRPIASGASGLPQSLRLHCDVCTRCTFQLRLQGGEYSVRAYAGRPGGHVHRPLRSPPIIVRPHIIPALGDAGPRNLGIENPSRARKQSNHGFGPEKSLGAEVSPANPSRPQVSKAQQRPTPSDQTKQGGLSSEKMKQVLMQSGVSEGDGVAKGSDVISADQFERIERAAVSGVQSALASGRRSASKAESRKSSHLKSKEIVDDYASNGLLSSKKSKEIVDERCRPSAGMLTDSTVEKSMVSRTRSESRGIAGPASRRKQNGLSSENMKEVLALNDSYSGLCGKNGVGPDCRVALHPRDQNCDTEDAHHRRDLHHHHMEFGPPPRSSHQHRQKRQEIALPIGGFAMY